MTRPTRSAANGTAIALVTFTPIGVIRSPHRSGKSTPIQPTFAPGVSGSAEIFPEYAGGLTDLEDFSHIHLIYYLHRAEKRQLIVRAFLDEKEHGVFATRAPFRPNPIGLSLVQLAGIEGRILKLLDLDLLDGTPLLDIKPHIPDFDCRQDVRCGWYDRVDKQAAERRGRRAPNDT